MFADLRLFEEVSPSIQEITEIPGTWIIRDLLTENECQYLMSNIVHDEELDTTAYKREDEVEILPKRISYRFKEDNLGLSLQFFERIRNLIPNTLTFDREDDDLGSFLVGSWKL